MEFQFLGTSAGTPTRRRNVSALALRSEGARHWALVDCGEGTQHRILRTPWSLNDLRAVFVTHLHGDHCYGLPGLLASAAMMNRTAPLVLAGPAPLRAFLEGVMATTGLGLPYALDFVEVGGTAASALPDHVMPDLAVAATALSHRVPSFGYTFTERRLERKLDPARLQAAGVARGAAWGRLQRGEDVVLPDGRPVRADDVLAPPRKARRVIVAGDNDRPELLLEEARSAEVLVHEATYTDEVLCRIGPGPQHSSARMTAAAAAAAGVPNLVLTHFSPRYQQHGALAMADLEEEARAAYGGRLFLANDFDRFQLDRDGVLHRLEDDAGKAGPAPAGAQAQR
ncbi:MBL fold metallo-hydrolase [Massilia forsythiae]|uniref:Ribonuclease Z n=1 Tax=Massilia forsythiae TaxID=2728020 RepID=A0A7Z2ZUV0_9BURK|nr:MBL fold metallo-hydrolase [Massilia forsythiae]QJE02799.1 MBL fold metallo-hydrolase [Massilia forsythiae]